MTDATYTETTANPLTRLFRDEPVFTGAAILLALLTIPTLAAMALDPRTFQLENVWIKPLKFQVALSVYLITLAFYARWLPQGLTDRRGYKVYAWIVVLAIAAETLWVSGAAANATASHFNVATPVMAALYGLMGVLAVTLTSAALTYGVAIWRNPATGLSDPMRLSLALGLILTFGLTVIVAGTMSSQPGHFVGTPVTHATYPVMGWSAEVGDLRLPHFFATHAMHVVPLAALVFAATRRMAWLLALGFAALTLVLFAQALAGQPLLGVVQ
jgi:hypothetical protein